ncbi:MULTISPECIES: lantibiotic dehydratase [unclassified Nonomuraea]|uniref:lantibiotic dehydratase n=1 Tax=unclassified Nonomuraea TaxID=2593643 RepID=UPI0033FB8E06
MEPSVVVRVAGVPVAALSRLRLDSAYGRAEGLARLAATLRRDGEALSEALYPLIGALNPGTSKPALVGLRRALHQRRLPRDTEWNARVAALLPAEVGAAIESWIVTRHRLDEGRRALDDVFAAELREKELVLRDVAGHPGFRRALSQASPALFSELAKWLADARRRPRRQSMARLAKYLARAAAKTSPYGTFMASGTGTWADAGSGGSGGSPVRFVPAEIQGVLEIHTFLLQRIGETLTRDPRLARHLVLRVNPSATLQDGTVSFIGRSTEEPIVTMPATAAVEACLSLAERCPGSTLVELRSRLAGGGAADESPAEAFLQALVRAGLLEEQHPVADQSADPLGDLAEWVADHGGAEFADVVQALRRVRRQARLPVVVDDVEGHWKRQHELEAALTDLAGPLGFGPAALDGQGRHTFRENAVFTGPVAEAGSAVWRPALEDLDVVRRWLGAFDLTLPFRIALGAYFAERFGPGARVPLLVLHRALQEVLARDGESAGLSDAAREVARLMGPSLGAGGALSESPLPRLRELAAIQREARQAVLAQPESDGVVSVPAEVIRKLTEDWPSWVEPPRSLACYVQVVPGHGGIGLVLNAAHTGYGRGRSRVLALMAEATGESPATGHRPSARVLAELGGVAASALNRRVPHVAYEIDYPFAVSSRPAEERIPLGDLGMVLDPRSGLLKVVSDRLGADLSALHLGMMSDLLLPPAARLLIQVSGETHYVHPSIPLLADQADLELPSSSVAYPRVEIGGVVIQRARRIVPKELLPERAKGEGDAAYLLRLASWLHEHDLPARSFVRFARPDEGEGTGDWTQWIFDKSRKPVYVDFANWFLVTAFEKMLASSGPMVIFDEVLPDFADALGPDPDDPSVTEFLIEISDQDGRNA